MLYPVQQKKQSTPTRILRSVVVFGCTDPGTILAYYEYKHLSRCERGGSGVDGPRNILMA